MTTVENLKHQLEHLKEEHRRLDDEMKFLVGKPLYDQLALQRLKKRKLRLKEEILKLRKKLFPDIIA